MFEMDCSDGVTSGYKNVLVRSSVSLDFVWLVFEVFFFPLSSLFSSVANKLLFRLGVTLLSFERDASICRQRAFVFHYYLIIFPLKSRGGKN